MISDQNIEIMSDNSDYQPISFSDLKVKFKTARESLDSNFFPEELLNEFADYIDYVVEKGPLNTVYTEPELKRFFFEEFVGGIAKRLKNIKQLPDQYLPLVSRLVLSLGELFGQEVERDNGDMADAIRYLFDQSCSLHQHLFQSEESNILKAFHDPSLGDRIPEEERIWRKSLSPGMKIDAIKRDNEHNLKSWQKATVMNVDGDLIQVLFDNDSTNNYVYFWWYSPDINHHDLMSKGDEWRLDLKVGDIVDAHDSTKVWYQSTIIDKVIITEENGNEYAKLKVGFRTYHPEGNKYDGEQRSFFGYSESFDEWIPACSPRIQKYQTFAKSFQEAQTYLGRHYEETFEDQMDMLLYSKIPGKPVFGVVRNKCRSGLLVTFLNKLGQQGVFQKILDQINKDNYDQLSLETLFYYLDSISNSYMMFNKAFINDYYPALYQAVRKKILTSSEASLKTFRKDRIDSLIQYIFNILMTRLMPYQPREQEKNMFTLEIGSYFLKLNFLEKRIDGAKMISEVCKAASMMTFQASIETTLNHSDKQHTFHFIKLVIDSIKRNNILQQIFSKERSHQQLVERGEEVLKLMITQDYLTQEELDLVWGATKLDETTQLELYKLFNELSSRLKINEINFIIEQLSQVPLSKILNEQVDLIYEIGKRAKNGETQYGHQAVEYMWRIAIPSIEQVDKVLVNKASMAITDIIKNWDNQAKITYLRRILDALKLNQEGFLCIKMISRIIREFQGVPTQQVVPEVHKDDEMQVDSSKNQTTQRLENRSQFIEYLEDEMQFMLHFILNFKHYMLKARMGLRQKQASDSNVDQRQFADKVLAERFNHSDQMNERIEFLKYIAINSSVKVTKDQLNVLWREMVEMQMFQEDSDLFFKFIKDVCDMYDQGMIIVEIDDIFGFFSETIFNEGSSDETIFSRMTLEGFSSIQSFFILLNQKNRKIARLQPMNPETNSSTVVGQYPPAPKMTSFSNATGSSYQNYSFSNKSKESEEDPGFQIQVAPWELNGIETLWKIVISSTHNGVFLRGTEFLIKLYTSVSYNLEKRLPEFEDSFINHCILQIKLLAEIILNRQEAPKEQFEKVEKPIIPFSTVTKTVTQRIQPLEESKILKYLTLLKELIINSEKEGTRGIKSHNGLFKGSFLDCLQVTNSIKNGSKYQTKMEIGVNSNTTLFELRKILGEHASRVYQPNGSYVQEKPCHPYSVRIYRYSGCLNILENENGKTLAELRFKKNEQLTVYKRNVFNSSRVSLLNYDKTDLSDQAKELFTEWFIKFAEHADPNDPNSRLVLTRDSVKLFIQSCTDTEFVKDDDEQLVSMFKNYDLNQDGLIEETEFMTFWRTSVFDCEYIVWQNIFNFGYRYDLKPQALDGLDPEMYQLRNTIEEMPRYKLSEKQDYFDSLFNLVETMNHEVAHSAWTLIKTMTTNPKLYHRVVALDRDPGFNWDDIFDLSSIHKMLYILQIVEALIEEASTEVDQSHEKSEIDSLKSNWFERFMSLGGFQQILEMFHKSLEIISSKNADLMSKFEKNFIEQMLKLIRIFVIAAYSSTDDASSVIDVLDLVRNKSKNLDDQVDVEMNDKKEEKEEYKTPAKQVKGKFVQRLHEKRVQFSNNDDGQDNAPEITTEFLFGDNDNNGAENNQKKQTSQEDDLPNISSKNIDAINNSPGDDSKKQFKALAMIMKASGQSQDILQKIDFKDLQTQILEVICLILGKQELGIDDTQIVEHALSLWLATLVKNGLLLNDFYQYSRPGVTKMFAIKNVDELVAHGLFTYKSLKVREDFSTTIKMICQKVVNDSQGGMSPVLFFLKLLRRNYPREDLYFMYRECRQYFDLFASLIEEYHQQLPKEAVSEINVYDILSETINKLKAHESKEKKGSALEDKTLIGYFNMLEKLIKIIKNRGVDKDQMEQAIIGSGILEELFYEHLFFNPNSKESGDNKSKTKESRTAAYAALQATIEILEPHQLADFLEDKVWNLIKDMNRPKEWKFVPSDNSRQISSSNQNYVGIVNLGCICYMNSMMQQFFMVPQFRYQLLKAIDESPLDLKEYKGYIINDNLLKQLQIMFANLELSERQAFFPLGFCFAFKDFDGNPTNTAIQQDAQEFLNIFFARLEELLKPTTQKHLLDSVFGGKTCSQLKCSNCGNIRNKLETFYTLSVTVKDRKGLLDSLQKMIESSTISDFKCENCSQKVDVEKRQLIAEPPNVLIVHLQRIQFNFDTFQNEKINSHFDFPTVLDLSEFSFKNVMQSEGHPSELLQHEDVKHLQDIDDDEYIYKLVGVTIHRGTAEHGHYYALINTKRGKEEADEFKPEWQLTESDPWKKFDDETVKYFNFNELKSEAFGGTSGGGIQDSDLSAYYMQSVTANSYGQNAYMLVYEKQKKKPLKEVIVEVKQQEEDEQMQEDNSSASGPSSASAERNTSDMQVDQLNENNIISGRSQASLERIDTATSRVNAASSTLADSVLAETAPSPSKQAEEQDYLLDPSNGEKYKLINYKQVDPYVPDWIKGQILQDNAMFMIDMHIYHEQFFNFIKNSLRHIANHSVMIQHQYKLDYLQHFHRLKTVAFNIAQKSLFDMLSYFLYNTQMSDITSSLQTIFTFSDSPYSLTRGDRSLLNEIIQHSYLEDDCSHFLNIMFQCTDKTSRFYIGRLTSMLINKAYSVYRDALDKKIVLPASLVELKENADKLVIRFFKALKTPECIKNWQKIDQYLQMLYNIATDSLLQQELILDNFEIVPYLLDFLLANVNMKTSSKLSTFEPIVGLICFFTRFSLTPAMKLECDQWVEDSNEGIKQPSTLLGYYVVEMRGQPEKHPLKDEHLDYMISSEFIELCLKEGVQTQELGRMIAHLCYKFDKFSRRMAKLLLHGISRGDYDKVKNYLDVVTHIALVRDQFQQSRLEWMFGIGILNSHTSQVSITNDPTEVLTKVGVKILHSLSDEAFSFKSSLIQDTIDDSLLHLLWRYRGRMDTYTVNCLQGLLNLISMDDIVAEFFAKLPSPTYTFARYTDWIMPYLEKQLVDAKKGFAGSYSSQKEEIVVKCMSLYEKYAAYIKRNLVTADDVFTISYKPIPDIPTSQQVDDLIVEDIPMDDIDLHEKEENIRNLISPQNLERGESNGVIAQCTDSNQNTSQAKEVLRCDPQPYIVVDCLNEKLVFENDFGGVVMQIYSLGCFYTESLPTGDSNIAVPKGYFKKNLGTYNGAKSLIQGGQQKNQEQEMQAQCLNNYFRSQGLANKNTGERRNGILIDRDQNKDYEEEHRDNYDADDDDHLQSINQHKPSVVIKDGDEQWEMINNQANASGDQGSDKANASFNSSGFAGNDDLNEIDVQEQIDLYHRTHQNQQEQSQVYKIKVVEENSEENQQNLANNTPTNANYDSPTFVTQNEPNFASAAQNEQDVVEDNANTQNDEVSQIQWPCDVNYCEELVYRVQVTNYRDVPIKCKILFSEQSDNSSHQKINLFYPKGGFKAMVQPQSQKTIIMLHKIRPDDPIDENCHEINKLSTEFYFKEKYQRVAGGLKSNQNKAIPPISLPLRNRNATAKVHPSSEMAREAEPLMNKQKDAKDHDALEDIDDIESSDNDDKNNQGFEDADYFDPDQAFEANNKNSKIQKSTNSNKADNQNNQNDDDYKNMVDSEILDQKQCPQCTYFNSLDSVFCEICFFDFK